MDWFVGPESEADLPADLRSRIRSEEPLLLTCTLRDAIVARKDLVEDLLRARSPHAETIVLACENAPDPAYAQIAESCDSSGLRLLRTVVNRMCIGLPPDGEGRRMVSAHPLGEWLIERSDGGAVLEALAAVREVELADDIDARQDRKLWMVNGAHQALALMARAGGTGNLRIPTNRSTSPDSPLDDLQRAAQNRRVAGRLSHLHAAMDIALHHRHPAMVDNLSYGLEHVEAYSEHPDSVRRVLGAFTRADLVPFIETLNVRLGAPARVCHELGVSVASFAFVFDVFESLVEDLDAYLDADEIRAGSTSVSREADMQAVEAYERLVAGWSSGKEAETRLGRFTEALAASRP